MELHLLAEPPEVVKTVTILFTDLVGSTSLGEQLDPESLHYVLSRYFDAMALVLRNHGGTVRAYIGDAIMAVFGLPVAHEDDALRALRAAAEMKTALSELNVTLQSDWGLSLANRTGVYTGEVVAADPSSRQLIVSGDAANVAARLEQSAAAGEVLLGEPTLRMVHGAIEAEPIEPLILKGKSEAVPAWRLLRITGETARVQVESPFVGRDSELTELELAFRAAVQGSAARSVVLVGEPGIGKSRLVGEFSARLRSTRRAFTLRVGRCLPYGDGITFWAYGEVLKSEAGILESDSSEVAASKLADAVGALTRDSVEQAWLNARLAPLVGVTSVGGGSVDRTEFIAAWRRFLEALALRAPLVLVLEDLHWADEAMLASLGDLFQQDLAAPVLTIATTRPEIKQRTAEWVNGTGSPATIELKPLDDTESEQLVSALLGRTALPPRTQSMLIKRAEGNPLYAEEFARMLADKGLLDEQGQLTQDITETVFPDRVQALIAARLDALPPHARSVIQDGSVVGRVFWQGAIASMEISTSRRSTRHSRSSSRDSSSGELRSPASTTRPSTCSGMPS